MGPPLAALWPRTEQAAAQPRWESIPFLLRFSPDFLYSSRGLDLGTECSWSFEMAKSRKSAKRAGGQVADGR